VTGEFRTDLEPIVIKAEEAVLDVVRALVPTASLQRIGPIDINGPSWSCWVITQTDSERDRLASDRALERRLFQVATDAGFAPDSFTFQSQETVDRDLNGSWFNAMR